MHLSSSDIFWKSWKWALIGGITLAISFWVISDIGGLFHGENGGNIFLDLLISVSIIGGYVGAGLVTWRIADKYYASDVATIKKRYMWYSILSFLVLVAVVYSPLSFLAMLWSFLAPFCVLRAFARFKPAMPSKARSRQRRRTA